MGSFSAGARRPDSLEGRIGRPPPCLADHSRKIGRSSANTNHEWTRIDAKTDGTPSTTSGIYMRLRFRPPGTMSSDDAPLGARASRPHKAWDSLGHLPHWDQRGNNTMALLRTGRWGLPPTKWLPAASQGNSAAANGAACGRDARAPRGCPSAGWVRNIDRQDEKDEKLLHRKLTHSLTGRACEGIQEPGGGFEESLFKKR